jgi:Tfp pilus assembly protein PilO
MKKLSPAKKNQLVLTIVGTLAVISMVYFFLISPQQQANHTLADKTAAKQAELDKIKLIIKQAGTAAQTANEAAAKLSAAEGDVASGDVFAWIYDTIRQFKAGYRVEIPNLSQPSQSEVDLIPNFPYKQIKVTLQGSGFYHDIGRFIADLENKFPHLRVVNLNMEPVGDQTTEKLTFRMEIVALTKSPA